MQITELYPPTNGGTLFFGRAQSTRGRRYEFKTDMSGKISRRVKREGAVGIYWPVALPKSLATIARRAVGKAAQS